MSRLTRAVRGLPDRVDARKVVAPSRPQALRLVRRAGLNLRGRWWTPTDEDPHLVFVPPPWGGFPVGPTRLSLNLDVPCSIPVDLELHVDTGQGYREDTKTVLPRTHGGELAVIVDLPANLLTLRLDLPEDLPASDLRDVSLQRVATGDPDAGRVWRQPGDDYPWWIEDHGTPTHADLDGYRRLAAVHEPPTFSVVMPVFDPDPRLLAEAIASVRAQVWPHWELCICDDASTNDEVIRVLDEQVGLDERIRVVRRPVNGNISAASNDALGIATGAWVALLDHDDMLAPHALARVAKEIVDHPGTAVLYSDEDKVTVDGRRLDPYCKPDLSLELLYGQNVVNHLGVYARDAVDEAGGFRSEFDGSQDYDLLLRILEKAPIEAVRHIPEILYHWRIVTGSVALAGSEKGWANDTALEALVGHIGRVGLGADVVPIDNTSYRRLVGQGSAPSFEVIDLDVAERVNATARGSAAGVLVMVAPDTKLAADDAESLARAVAQHGIGAAGPAVMRSDGRWYCAAMVVDRTGTPHPVLHGHPGEDQGLFGRGVLAQRVSAVGGGVIAVDRQAFLDVGGLDESSNVGDQSLADLCLRLAHQDQAVLFVASVRAIQGSPPPANEGRKSSGAVPWERDPWWNPALSVEPADGSLRS